MKTKSPLLRLDRSLAALVALLALFAAPNANAQLYTGTNSTGLWSSTRWDTATNGAFTTAWTANSASVFLSGGTYTFTGLGTISIGNVTVQSNATVTFSGTSGTPNTGGNVRTIDVGTNSVLDFTNQAFSTASGTGFIKTGSGVLATAGGGYGGGFTLDGGTMVMRGVNAMGGNATNILTLSNGVVAADGTTTLANTKYGGGIRIAGNIQFGALTNSYAANAQALISETANLAFANDVSLQGAQTQ